MPDLNKQTLVNLLIDSPLREPIKINLIDIVNNTADADLPKVYPTIVKELEIFQKATERRMKLAEETVAKLSEGGAPAPAASSPAGTPSTSTASLPPLPPLPAMPSVPPMPAPVPAAMPSEGLSVPPLDLPPLPQPPAPTVPTPQGGNATTFTPTPSVPSSSDEAALSEIQKELDALKSSATADATPAPTPQA